MRSEVDLAGVLIIGDLESVVATLNNCRGNVPGEGTRVGDRLGDDERSTQVGGGALAKSDGDGRACERAPAKGERLTGGQSVAGCRNIEGVLRGGNGRKGGEHNGGDLELHFDCCLD